MKYDPKKHPFDAAQGRHRRSIRLKGYDYAQAGAYFVTIVAWQRRSLFGKIVNGGMILNRYGEIVQRWWEDLSVHFLNVETGAFVIMPNHVHGIIWIQGRRGTVSVPNDHDDPQIMGGDAMQPPYEHQQWDRSLPISNTNPQKK